MKDMANTDTRSNVTIFERVRESFPGKRTEVVACFALDDADVLAFLRNGMLSPEDMLDTDPESIAWEWIDGAFFDEETVGEAATANRALFGIADDATVEDIRMIVESAADEALERSSEKIAAEIERRRDEADADEENERGELSRVEFIANGLGDAEGFDFDDAEFFNAFAEEVASSYFSARYEELLANGEVSAATDISLWFHNADHGIDPADYR